MENDKKWKFQCWNVPHPVRLDRRGEQWDLTFFCGSVPITVKWGEKLAYRVDAEQTRLNRRYRRSISFRWIRFWYLRKHRKEVQ
jgi:hypothetical protein